MTLQVIRVLGKHCPHARGGEPCSERRNGDTDVILPKHVGMKLVLSADGAKDMTIDWTVRENARAQIRVIVKRILRRHGHPPDKQEKATLLVLEQAEVLCKDWSGLAA